MIPAPFDYVRAESVEHALQMLAQADREVRILAGGHSLIPMMKLRLAAPEILVDISDLNKLQSIYRDGETLCIGAGARYVEILQSDLVHQMVPLLPQVVRRIGDPQIRYRGTIGGSACHADPAADLPAALRALDADFVIRSLEGQRTVAATDFFADYFTTDVSAAELLVEIRIPATYAEQYWYERFSGQEAGWAIVAVAVAGTRIGLGGMGPTPLRAHAAEDVLASGGDEAAAAELADHDTAPLADSHAEADYRRHLARVLTQRALLAARRSQKVTKRSQR